MPESVVDVVIVELPTAIGEDDPQRTQSALHVVNRILVYHPSCFGKHATRVIPPILELTHSSRIDGESCANATAS